MKQPNKTPGTGQFVPLLISPKRNLVGSRPRPIKPAPKK